jgi:hypothetical protein
MRRTPILASETNCIAPSRYNAILMNAGCPTLAAPLFLRLGWGSSLNYKTTELCP